MMMMMIMKVVMVMMVTMMVMITIQKPCLKHDITTITTRNT